MDETSESGPSDDRGGPPEIPRLNFFGELAEKCTLLSSTVSMLVLAIAQNDETKEQVLLPILDTRFAQAEKQYGDDDISPAGDSDEIKYTSNTLMMFDNVCYLLADFAADIRRSSRQINRVSSSGIPVEPKRVEMAAYFLGEASKQLKRAEDLLRDALATSRESRET